MASYFLDSCAVAKRYVLERGTADVQQLCALATANNDDLYISAIARVEVVRVICATARRLPGHRQRRLMARDGQIARFLAHCDVDGDYAVIELRPEVVDRANVLCKAHGIKSLDAIQLASAVVVRDFARAGRPPDPDPIFVTADTDLQRFARTTGFSIRNPEEFPGPAEVNLPFTPSGSTPDVPATWHNLFDMLGRLLLRR